jgi:hypothetical protein
MKRTIRLVIMIMGLVMLLAACGSTGTRLATLAGSGEWKAGKRFPGSATEEDVRKWIESLRQ